MLLEGNRVPNFHLQDELLCHLGHLCVPSSKCAKMIWEAHYSRVTGHFGVKKTVEVPQKYLYWPNLRQDVGKYIRSYTVCAITKRPSRSNASILRCLTLVDLGNPSPWVICRAFLLLSMETIVFFWSSIDSQRWPLWRPTRRISQQKPLLNSSLNKCGYNLGSHSLSSHIRTVGSSVYFGPSSGQCWTPSSPSPHLSIPKMMARQRSSTR
jgi:hypothetical protein